MNGNSKETRGPVGLTRIQEIRLYCNDPAWGEFKYRTKGPEEGFVPDVSGGKEKNGFFKSRLFNFKSILTRKGPNFSDSGMAWEGAWNVPPSVISLYEYQ